MYTQPPKSQDPRVPGKQVSFASNTMELVYFAVPSGRKRGTKVMHRADFNTCGESSTTSKTYTGVPMRRFGELPRMDCSTKTAIFGATASGVLSGKRLQADVEMWRKRACVFV